MALRNVAQLNVPERADVIDLAARPTALSQRGRITRVGNYTSLFTQERKRKASEIGRKSPRATFTFTSSESSAAFSASDSACVQTSESHFSGSPPLSQGELSCVLLILSMRRLFTPAKNPLRALEIKTLSAIPPNKRFLTSPTRSAIPHRYFRGCAHRKSLMGKPLCALSKLSHPARNRVLRLRQSLNMSKA